jgi:hypothetical protein
MILYFALRYFLNHHKYEVKIIMNLNIYKIERLRKGRFLSLPVKSARDLTNTYE